MKKADFKPRVLLYGFSSFGRIRQNPSALAVRYLHRSFAGKVRLKTVVFRVSYKDVKAKLKGLFQKEDFDIAIGFGVSAGSREFRIETLARNWVSKNAADVDGRKKRSGVILRARSAFIRCPLNTRKIKRSFSEKRLPAVLSTNAGDYLCNYAFYLTALQSRKTKPRMKFGFLHLPLHLEYINRKKLAVPGLPMREIRAAARLYVSTIAGCP